LLLFREEAVLLLHVLLFSIAAILPATLSMFRTFKPSSATIASAKAAADDAWVQTPKMKGSHGRYKTSDLIRSSH